MNSIPEELQGVLCQLGLNNLCRGTCIENETYLSNVCLEVFQTGSNEFFYDVSFTDVCIQDDTISQEKDSAPNVLNDNKKERLKNELIKIIHSYYDDQIKKENYDKAAVKYYENKKWHFETMINDKNQKLSRSSFTREQYRLYGNKISEYLRLYGDDSPMQVSHSGSTISEKQDNVFEKWGKKAKGPLGLESLAYSFIYNLANNYYVISQVISAGYVNYLLGRPLTNPSISGRGGHFNIDGSDNFSPIDNLVNVIPSLFGQFAGYSTTSLPAGFGYIEKLTKSQFANKSFSVLKPFPSIKTALYRSNNLKKNTRIITNYIIKQYNQQVSEGHGWTKIIKMSAPKEGKTKDKQGLHEKE